jgi:dynamin-binding protein
MSEHDFDEDHNYYTKENRQSQFPDYDVTAAPLNQNFATLPSLAYRQSREYSPKRPTIQTNFDYNASNGANNLSIGSSIGNPSPDPHEFYRQYRDSFTRRPESVYGALDIHQSNLNEGMAAVRSQQRNSSATNRLNGYSSTPVSSRWNRSLENRSSLSPLADKPSTSTKQGSFIPRGRQTSLQALVEKFNSVTDENLPLPAKPDSRTSSANQSPTSSTPASKSFRSRASLDRSQPAFTSPKSRATRDGRGSIVKRRLDAGRSSGIKSPNGIKRSSAISNNTHASQSMVDLNPPPEIRKPLFGEILQAGANDPGYGIPGGRRRRGSEGSMHHPSPMFQDDSNEMIKVSPTSPTAWYLHMTPTLEGIDLDKPIPPKHPGMHRRSRSDFGASGGFALAPLPPGPGKTITVLPTPQEASSPPPTPSTRPRYSRIPISTRNARRTSITSDSGNSSGYKTPTRISTSFGPPSLPPPQTPDHLSRSSTPRRSPRHRKSSPPRQPSPRLAAYIAEQTPLKSPPLRSSRPRQPVSTATTAASRARAASNAVNQNNGNRESLSKKPSEVQSVNMDQRRQMITRAFTKSWHEKEEDRRKRMSFYIHDQNDSDIPAVPSPRIPIIHQQKENVEDSIQDGEIADSSELFASPVEEYKPEKDLIIDTSHTTQNSIDDLDQGDSPTLGTAGFAPAEPMSMNSTPEPSSAVSAGTGETFFENEPQTSPPNLRSENNGSLGPTESLHEELPNVDTPRRVVQSINSDLDDGESIHIMLSDSPMLERQIPQDLGPSQPLQPLLPLPSLPAVSSVFSRQIQDESIATRPTPVHDSMSTTITQNEEPWSPQSISSFLSGHSTLDSESYTVIDRLLEAYNDPSATSPDMMSEAQRRLFSQSPGLARAGGWDPGKTTQLYLQSRYRKSPDLNREEPRPLNARSGTEESLTDEQIDKSPATEERPKSPHGVIVDKNDVFTDSPVSRSLGVPASTINHRASLTHRDDWVNTSPSMLDWMQHQAIDTPAAEIEDALASTRKALNGEVGPSVLPDIPSGGLGIDMPSELPVDSPSIPPNISEIYTSPVKRVEMSAVPTSPIRKPLPLKLNTTQQRPAEAVNMVDGITIANPKVETASSSMNDLTSERPSISSESISKPSNISADELKRLIKRKNIIKELIDTESSFGQDMTVVVDIYKGTCNVVLHTVQDERTLFGNAQDIVTFSTALLDSLKNAGKSIYVLPKSKRWRSKRDSNATQESTATDDHGSIAGPDLTEDEKDRMTCIGAAFSDHIVELERVYTEYLKNHDQANAKLQQLQKSDKVQVWLKECRAYAHDLTTAWDLDSLLVKPVQRLLKYPLLLEQLISCTPENHPDYTKLDIAFREIQGVSRRINDAKKRADLVEIVAVEGKKKKKDEGRLGLPKAFGRRSEKFKQQVGLADSFQDRDYNQVSEKFGSHFFQLQVVMRDVEMYVVDVQAWVSKFTDVVISIDEYLDVGPTTYPEIESKWRKFRLSMREIQMTALTDHVNAVRKNVIEPMTTLLKLHDGPQKLMERRKKRVPDYLRYRALKDRGEKVDKKSSELAEQFVAVNDTLKDELPKLFSLTGRLVEACLNNFVQLQLQWQGLWRRKMIQAIQLQEVPRSFGLIVTDFQADFRYTEAHVLSLGVCNGSILADASTFLPFVTPVSQTTTLVDDSSRRPSTNTEGSTRPRAYSNAGIPQNEGMRNRGYSAQSGPSPMLPSPDLGRPTESFGLGSHLTASQPQTGLRVRANSTASSRSPVTPDMPGGWRNQQSGLPPATHGRPSTSTGRSYDSFSRPSGDVSRFSTESNNRLRPDAENRFMAPRDVPYAGQSNSPVQRTSGIFSSAMPMSDSPRAASPTGYETRDDMRYKVLFLAASVYEFNIDRARREAGYPYLTYVAGEVSLFVTINENLLLTCFRYLMSLLKKVNFG